MPPLDPLLADHLLRKQIAFLWSVKGGQNFIFSAHVSVCIHRSEIAQQMADLNYLDSLSYRVIKRDKLIQYQNDPVHIKTKQLLNYK